MRLLIIGILDGHIGAASRIALERGSKVLHAESVEESLKILRAGSGADLVMIDVTLDVRALVDSLTAERIVVPVVACGVGNDTRAAVEAIKAGAQEYVPLPPDAELIAAVLAAVSQEDHAIIHADPAMATLLTLAQRIARSDAGVLITGPSGTGKELLARYVHARSRRSERRFVAVNCAAIPENLLESELFGHEKGAFTGAIARRIGRFEEAHGGTLLLDEISEMDVRLQAKLLRVIQERVVDRVGGSAPVKVDVRIIATSNRDLAAYVRQGHFREDLYFRLNVVTLDVPALRDRPRDIPALAEHFVKRFAKANGLPVPSLTQEARRALVTYAWPGNVRELENTLHRAVLLADGDTIGAEVISPAAGMAGGAAPATGGGDAASAMSAAAGTIGLIGRTVADVERDLILDTLHHCLGNRTHAANILGISIRTLRNKLRQYTSEGFPVPMPGEGERTLA
jgi:two-component system, response regulator FlrC